MMHPRPQTVPQITKAVPNPINNDAPIRRPSFNAFTRSITVFAPPQIQPQRDQTPRPRHWRRQANQAPRDKPNDQQQQRTKNKRRRSSKSPDLAALRALSHDTFHPESTRKATSIASTSQRHPFPHHRQEYTPRAPSMRRRADARRSLALLRHRPWDTHSTGIHASLPALPGIHAACHPWQARPTPAGPRTLTASVPAPGVARAGGSGSVPAGVLAPPLPKPRGCPPSRAAPRAAFTLGTLRSRACLPAPPKEHPLRACGRHTAQFDQGRPSARRAAIAGMRESW